MTRPQGGVAENQHRVRKDFSPRMSGTPETQPTFGMWTTKTPMVTVRRGRAFPGSLQ